MIISKVIKKIPVIHHNISMDDLEKICFPAVVNEILDIRIVNSATNKLLTIEDHSFAFSSNIECEENDSIFITYIPKDLPDVQITLKISQIKTYSCSLNEHVPEFSGARLDIMDGKSAYNPKYRAKYNILTSVDLFFITADSVGVIDAVYTKDK